MGFQEQPPMTDHANVSTVEDRTMPAVVYGLYLLGLTHGLTIIIGLIIAYACRDNAGPRMHSHYTFLIRTFWLSIGWFVVGCAIAIWGGVLSVVLIGLPFLWLGITICGLVWVWFLVRCIIGVIHLARDEAYPRPRALMF
jgi:uncharacterized membrane protein